MYGHVARPRESHLASLMPGAGFRPDLESTQMDGVLSHRSHFGSRYHTRADAVTQAFLDDPGFNAH